MPNAPKTPHRAIRIPNDTWQPAMEIARKQGTSAGQLCREFLDWYLRKPGAKLPKRPELKGLTSCPGSTGQDCNGPLPCAEHPWWNIRAARLEA